MEKGNSGAVVDTDCMEAFSINIQPHGAVCDSRSRFFALCRFLLGLLITLIGRLGNVPITLSGSVSEAGAVILTSASTFFFFSSTSEMNNCFPTQRPMYVVPSGGSLMSNDLPDDEVQSTAPSCAVVSPEMEMTTLGGQSLGSSPCRITSDHQEFPIMMAVGGGQRNLQRRVLIDRHFKKKRDNKPFLGSV
jgi:hypothetical protein